MYVDRSMIPESRQIADQEQIETREEIRESSFILRRRQPRGKGSRTLHISRLETLPIHIIPFICCLLTFNVHLHHYDAITIASNSVYILLSYSYWLTTQVARMPDLGGRFGISE